MNTTLPAVVTVLAIALFESTLAPVAFAETSAQSRLKAMWACIASYDRFSRAAVLVRDSEDGFTEFFISGTRNGKKGLYYSSRDVIGRLDTGRMNFLPFEKLPPAPPAGMTTDFKAAFQSRVVVLREDSQGRVTFVKRDHSLDYVNLGDAIYKHRFQLSLKEVRANPEAEKKIQELEHLQVLGGTDAIIHADWWVRQKQPVPFVSLCSESDEDFTVGAGYLYRKDGAWRRDKLRTPYSSLGACGSNGSISKIIHEELPDHFRDGFNERTSRLTELQPSPEEADLVAREVVAPLIAGIPVKDSPNYVAYEFPKGCDAAAIGSPEVTTALTEKKEEFAAKRSQPKTHGVVDDRREAKASGPISETASSPITQVGLRAAF